MEVVELQYWGQLLVLYNYWCQSIGDIVMGAYSWVIVQLLMYNLGDSIGLWSQWSYSIGDSYWGYISIGVRVLVIQ